MKGSARPGAENEESDNEEDNSSASARYRLGTYLLIY